MRTSIFRRTEGLQPQAASAQQQAPAIHHIKHSMEGQAQYPNSNIRQFLNMRRLTKDKGCLIIFLTYCLALVVMLGIGFFYGNYNDLGYFVNDAAPSANQINCNEQYLNQDMTMCSLTCATNYTFLGRVCLNVSSASYNPSFSAQVDGLISMYNIKYTFPMIIYVTAGLLGVCTILFLLIIYLPKLIYVFICTLFFMLLGMAFYLLKNVELRIMQYQIPSNSIFRTSEEATRSISFLLLGLYLLIFPFVLFSPKKIKLGVYLVQKLKQFYQSMLSMITFTVLIILVTWGTLIIQIFLIMHFYTAGTISTTPQLSMFHTYDNINLSHPAALTFHFIGIFWVYSTVVSWHRYFISSSMCMWFFQESQNLYPVRRGLKRSLHHLGTAALDGILMPVQWLFLLIFAIVKPNDQQDLQKEEDQISCVSGCINVFRNFFISCCRSINRDSPSSAVLTNYGYLESCQNSFQIMNIKSHRFFNIGGTLTIFLTLFSGILWIIIMYFISYYAVLNKQFPPVITSIILPVFCVFIIGIIIGCMFSNIYTAAVDSLLYCYLIERKSIVQGAEIQRTQEQLKIKKTLDQCYCKISDDINSNIYIYEEIDQNTFDLTYISKKQ